MALFRKFGRRKLLAVAGLGVVALGGGIAFWNRHGLRYLYAMRSRLPPLRRRNPRAPEKTGTLNQSHAVLLSQLVEAIGSVWFDGMELAEPDVNDVVELKTSQKPSYLTEYRSAARLFSKLMKNGGRNGEDVLRKIVEAAADEDSVHHREALHADVFVIKEFAALYLARGGFKAYELDNYRGYPGGLRLVNGRQP